MDSHSPSCRLLPAIAGFAIAAGLGTALVTGQGVAQAQPLHDPPGGPSSNTSSSSTSPSGSMHFPVKAPSGNQPATGSSPAPGSDAGSKKPTANAQTDTATTPSGTGPQRHTVQPQPGLSLPFGLSASPMPKPHPAFSLPTLGPPTAATNVKAAPQSPTPPAMVKAAVVDVTTPTAARPLESPAAIPAPLTAPKPAPTNLLTGLLGLVGLGASAAPRGPTPVDGPLSLVVAAAARSFEQPMSNVVQPLAAPAATTGLATMTKAAPSPALLPQRVALGLLLTRVFFPDINQLLETGKNQLATGHPVASRAVIYNNSTDDNLRVTYAIDVYPDVVSAKTSYREALQLSLAAPGFQQLPDPGIGDESFAGTSSGTDPVTGAELKHIGVGVRIGNIIIGVTRAGYVVDPQTIRTIQFLTRLQVLKASLLVPLYNFFGWL